MLAFQVISVSVEIICRYFFNISFSVITPLNEWSLVYLTFVGRGMAAARGRPHQRRLHRDVAAGVGEFGGPESSAGLWRS